MLPGSIKVGYAVYRVEPLDPAEAAHTDSNGYCDQERHIIKVRTDLARAETVKLLLHELTHAIAYSFEMPKDIDDEETVANVMSAGLTTVLADNRHLIKWLDLNLHKAK